MRTHAAAAGLIVAMLAMVAPASEAQVYKCQTGVGMTYQAEPCKNAPHASPHIAAPARSSGSSAVAAVPDLHGSLASLRLGVQAAAADERELLAHYRRETDAMRNKMSRASDTDKVRAQQALAEDWAPRIRAAQIRQEQFHREIVRRCPAGAMPGTQDAACNQ